MVAPATATAISSVRRLGLIGLAVAAVACGGGHSNATGFRWLRPGPAPGAWRMVALPSGDAALPVPPGWRLIKGDSGTVSAAVFGSGRTIVGYLNATPRQTNERLAGWAKFRTEHNADEGNSDVHTLASATRLRFRTGTGSCVDDSYRTPVTSYREIACLVRGRRGSTVIVAAATPSRWPQLAPVLERAISAFTT